MLGVTADANEREIKRAYYRLARTMHPDKAVSAEEARRMEVDFAPISQAYNILKDKQKRKEYDEQLQKNGQTYAEEKPSSPAPITDTSAESGGAAPKPAMPRRPGGSQPAGPRRVSEDQNAARSAIARKAFSRGMQFYNAGEFAKAIEYFEAAVQNDANEPVFYARLAKALIQARRSFTKARELALKAIELDPYNSDYRMVLGEICEAAGSYSLAAQAYRDVLRWEPDNARAQMQLNAIEKSKKSSFLDKMLSVFKKN